MKEYHKIHSIYKRDEKTKKFNGEFSKPEFELLKGIQWEWTEKIDGTNIRIFWDGFSVSFGGRTESSQIPAALFAVLQKKFTPEKLGSAFGFSPCAFMLVGEGYGTKIQNGGGYIPDGVDFILFDVICGNLYLERDSVNDIARNLSVLPVPIMGQGTLAEAEDFVKQRPNSMIAKREIEGVVARPKMELLDRCGGRIITKIKCKDYE